MKVGILTFPNSTSYGAVLQMYAMYRAVQDQGAEPEIINYHNCYMKEQLHTRKRGFLRKYGEKLVHNRQIRSFRKFERGMQMYPKKPIDDTQPLFELGDRYDRVICGSDQVWNPGITGADMRYFLNFCDEKTKRIAYAPSFGITEFSADFKSTIKKQLHFFHRLSAREMAGQKLVEELTDRPVTLVLDPTFLLDRKEWGKLEQPHPAAKGDYILYYRVLRSDSLLRLCLKMAEQQNKKVIFVGGNTIRQLKNKNKRLEYAYDLSPGQWLYLVHHASCVVTNSFHGTAFAIHYEKDFFMEQSSFTNSRLEQIVRTTGLQDRVVGPGMCAFDEHIDYQQVRQRLKPELERSISYLKEALEA